MTEHSTPKSLYRTVLMLTLISLVLPGCSIAPSFRIEQVIPIGDRIQVVVSTGTRVHVVDSSPSLRGLRYYLLEFSLAGETCPPATPLRAADLNADMWPISQEPGVRLDFLMGGDPDRMVRILRRAAGTKVRVDVAVLAPASEKEWRVLKSWSMTDPIDIRSIIPSVDGRLLVFTSDPVRVLDTRSMQEIEPPAGLNETVQRMFARTSKLPAEFLFTEELAGMQAWIHSLEPDAPEVIPRRSIQVERESTELLERPEDEILVLRDHKLARMEWVDWIIRTNQAYRGISYASGGPASPHLPEDLWDIDAHKSLQRKGGSRKCDGYEIVVHPEHGHELVRVLDLESAFQLSGDKFEFLGVSKAPLSNNAHN